MRNKLLLAASICLLAALGLIPLNLVGSAPEASSGGSAPSNIWLGTPPPELWMGAKDGPEWTSPGGLRARMTYDTENKKVIVHWEHTGSLFAATQEIPLSYYPTEAIHYEGLDICVAGKFERGHTILELVSVPEPELALDAGTGQVIGLEPRQGVAKNDIFMEKLAGLDMVRLIKRMVHDESRLMIRFWDSGDLYDLDPSSGQYSLLASTQAGSGALPVAQLSEARPDAWSGHHITLGAIYVFLDQFDDSVVPAIIRDANLDGVLDEVLSGDAMTWQVYDMSNVDSYHDWF